MDQSPRTPYRRRSSAVDVSYISASPQSIGHGQINSSHKSGALSHSRTTSSGSVTSPTAPRPLSIGGVDGFSGAANGFGNLSNGLHNLADELAEMGEESEGDGAGRQSAYSNGEESLHRTTVAISMDSHMRSSLRLSPNNKRYCRETSKYYGSDFGDDSDLDEAPRISPSLAAGMAAVETLALRGTVMNDSDVGKIVKRVADSLKDLTPQSNLEQYATRYAFFLKLSFYNLYMPMDFTPQACHHPKCPDNAYLAPDPTPPSPVSPSLFPALNTFTRDLLHRRFSPSSFLSGSTPPSPKPTDDIHVTSSLINYRSSLYSLGTL